MKQTAPHLPDDVVPARRARWFFSMMLVLSLLAGGAGGAYAMHLLLPGILDDLISALPLHRQVIRESEDVLGEFQAMMQVAQSIVRTSSGAGVASATSFTADGWLITDSSIFNKGSISIEHDDLIAIRKPVIDDATGLAFVKIDSQGMPVPRVHEGSFPRLGETLYVAQANEGIYRVSVSAPYGTLKSSTDLYESEVYHRVIFVDRELPENFVGAPVFSGDGALIGIVSGNLASSGNAVIIPSDHFLKTFRQVALEGAVVHPYLGVRFEVARGAQIQPDYSREGVSIKGSTKYGLLGVRPLSPAALSGLKNGDKILKIEDSEVGRLLSLPEVLLQYNPGQEVHIEYERDGEKKEVDVILGSK